MSSEGDLLVVDSAGTFVEELLDPSWGCKGGCDTCGGGRRAEWLLKMGGALCPKGFQALSPVLELVERNQGLRDRRSACFSWLSD